jgi:hypothetical protein
VENDKVSVCIVAEKPFHNANDFLRRGGEAIYGSAEPHRLADERHLSDWTVVLVTGFKQRLECSSVLSKYLCSKSQVFFRGDSAVDIGADAFFVLKPIIVPNQIENWVRTEALRVRFGVAAQAGCAHVLEHRLFPRNPVGEFFVQFFARKEG